MHLGLKMGPLCPIIWYQVKGALFLYWSSRWPQTSTLNIFWVQEKGAQICLSEAKAVHSHKMWAEASSSAPHLLHKRLLVCPIRWECLFRRRPMTTQDCVMLKCKNLVFVVRLETKISVQGCLWVLLRLCHITKCWVSTQHFIFVFMFCLETSPRTAKVLQTSEKNCLASLSAFSFLVPQHVQGPSTDPLCAG
jgi:hypothetical protein